MEHMKVNDNVSVGGQPAPEDLESIRDLGFKTVINLRTDDEEDMPMSPVEEGEKVQELGMIYKHVPVAIDTATPELVDQFRAELSSSAVPVFVHCASGKRSGAFVMMDQAVQNNMSGEQTLKKAEEMGFECDQPELKEFVCGYVDSHR